MRIHYLQLSPNGRNILGLRAQLGYVQGFGGDVAPPNNRFYTGGEADLRGFDIRGATPYGYVPNRTNVQLTNPDGTCVPRDPTNPEDNQCIQVPLPVYGIASIGGDTSFTTNLEYKIPIAGPVTFAFFDDFGIDVALNHGQLKQSPEGFASLTAPLYGCPVYNNGSCQGGIPGSMVGFQPNIRPISGTNFVPRMSSGAEISVIMPVINAPFRLYYAYNPLRLYERPYCNDVILGENKESCSAELITRIHVPSRGRRRLHVRRIDGGLWSQVPVPGAPQDLPSDSVDDVLGRFSALGEITECRYGPRQTVAEGENSRCGGLTLLPSAPIIQGVPFDVSASVFCSVSALKTGAE
jgi:outer membrane protein insertion porin family